jgi:pyridoxal phosphate enzyme (YggS family)
MAFNSSAYQQIKSSLPSEVEVVAVSKTKPISDILEAYGLGIRDFGENYVQELMEKQPVLPMDIRWHFIGHLQSNKVKYIAPYVHLIHGVDKPSLLDEIQKQAVKNNRKISVLIQLHVAKEETKFGFSAEEAVLFFSSGTKEKYSHIQFNGIMAMASFVDDEQVLVSEFQLAKKVFDELSAQMGSEWRTLSMGMSSDWKLAVKEGSTMLRIGSTLFGSRN